MTWTTSQKKVAIAGFLGWTLDAFDFFIMVFVLKDIANEFSSSLTKVTFAITLTLAMRPLGALIFGRLADRYGRRPIMMLDVGLFSLFELLTAFSPNLTVLLILRALFGIAMGGEWGVGASLAMETVPAQARGFLSGLLQIGYPTGYLLASIVYALFYNSIGWRGMFLIGVIPALLVLYIRRHISESPSWKANANQPKQNLFTVLRTNWKLTLYAILLMTCFNFFSHGSQDLYPTFLEVQQGFDTHTVGMIAIIYNIGAIMGGLFFGSISEYIGRRYAMMIAALIALPVLPLWVYSNTPYMLAIGAFLMQIAVQGAWGVIPAYLNELSPSHVRATFPGLVYQLGNLLAASNATLQTYIAMQYGYHFALTMIIASIAILIVTLVASGPESRGIKMQNL